MLADPEPPLSVLRGIVASPVFSAEGVLLQTPGYDPASRLYYRPSPGFCVPPVSPAPSRAELARATDLISNELLGDFPFTGEAERATVIAMGLQPFIREFIDGPTPNYGVEKPTTGTGATLLVECVLLPALGRDVPALSLPTDEDEVRKTVVAALYRSSETMLWDNPHRLDSAVLSAAITARIFEGRYLGRSEMLRLPVRCLWITTANNPQYSDELRRRTVRCRLDAQREDPWERTGFRHPDLPGWTKGHRADLVWALLTLGQAWIAEGRPRATVTFGTFELWAEVMGGVLQVAGIKGFLDNKQALQGLTDPADESWHELVLRWRLFYPNNEPVGVKDLWRLLMPAGQDPVDFDLGTGDEPCRRIRFGKRFGNLRDKVIGGYQIVPAGKRQGAQLWQLKPVSKPGP